MERRPPLLELDDALRLVWDAMGDHALPMAQADRDDPPTDRSAMDGVALVAADGVLPRRVLGTLYAGGQPAAWQITHGTCLKVMTGAVIPLGADAVMPVEDLREEEGVVFPRRVPHPGDFIRRRGEQARSGDLLLPPGLPRTAARTGLFASIGNPLPPLAAPKVAVASTGDEVVPDPAPHQIRDANSPMLADLVTLLGGAVTSLPGVPDEGAALGDFLEQARSFDVVLTSGGVSMGEKDLLPQALREAGATILFHRIRLKPGKPTLAALLGRTVFLGLPGNPVSAYLNARIFLPWILARLQGRPSPNLWRLAELTEPAPNHDDRPLLQPCVWEGTRLRPLPSKGSADLVRLAQADAFAWIPVKGHKTGPTRCLDVL